jgi:hypothetical protein
VIWQVRIGLAFRHDSFEVVFAREPEQSFPISVNVVAVQQTFPAFGRYCVKPELAVDQRQVPEVFSVPKPVHLLLVIRLRVLVPQDVEGVKERLGASEQEVSKLRLAVRIEADDFAIENTAATLQVASKSFL